MAQDLDPKATRWSRDRSFAKSVHLPPGDFFPAEVAPDEPRLLGLLVLDGLMTRRVSLDGKSSVDLLGPGDLIRPTDSLGDTLAMVPSHVEWRVYDATSIAILDARFERDLCHVQPLMHELRGRLGRQLATQGERSAIARQPRLSGRLHFCLWHLAERYGRRGREGVTLPLPLTHALLADLVAAVRPSVSRALKQLPVEMRPVRMANGYWWLPGNPPDQGELATPACKRRLT